MSALSDDAPRLMANGFRIVPIAEGFKFPKGIPDWHSLPQTSDAVDAWCAAGFKGVGIVLGENLVAIDIDILSAKVATKVKQLVLKITGKHPPMRVGKAPKLMMLFRTDTPISKAITPTYTVRGVKHQVEILGNGQLICSSGPYPDSFDEFTWITGDNNPMQVPLQELPVITEDQIKQILAGAMRIMSKAGWQADAVASVTPINDDARAAQALDNMKSPILMSETDIEGYLMQVPQAYVDGYDTWFKIIAAIHHQYSGSPAGYDMACKFSARSVHYDADEVQQKYESLGQREHFDKVVTFATVVMLASEGKPPAKVDGEYQLTRSLSDFRRLDIPPRDYWVRPFGPSTLNLLYGAPGTVKSYLALEFARAIHTGGTFLGEQVDLTVAPRTLVIDGEMAPEDLIERTKLVFPGEAPEHFHILSRNLVVAESDGKANPDLAQLEWQQRIEERIVTLGINNLIIDTKSMMFIEDENDPTANQPLVQWVVDLKRHGLCIWLIHHVGHQGHWRGASSWLGPGETEIILKRGKHNSIQLVFNKTRLGIADSWDSTMVLDIDLGTNDYHISVAADASESQQDDYRLLMDVCDNPRSSLRDRTDRTGISKSQVSRKMIEFSTRKLIVVSGKVSTITDVGEAYLVQGRGDEFDDLMGSDLE